MSDSEKRAEADELLKRIEKFYGFVPLVNQVLSDKPDVFIPFVELNKNAFFKRGALSVKTRELLAISAATALGSEHCLNVHINMAREQGASRDEIMESMVIGSLLSMTKSQSYAFRALLKSYEEKKDEDV